MAERITVNSKKPVSIKENLISHRRKTDFRSNSSPVNRILYLQRTVGNQAVQRMVRSGALQAKLRIGQPGDVYEQEADRVADAVMRMPEPQAISREVPHIQRVYEGCEEEELMRQPIEEEEEELRRQPEEEEEEELLQTKEISGQNAETTPDLESRINTIRGGGQPLAESDRAFFEPRFGTDFSQVRVHTDTQADDAARAVNARAFTVGQHIVFRVGHYTPRTSSGQHLLAHELVHTVQQAAGIQGMLVQRMTPCPPTLDTSDPVPSGWKAYNGNTCWFHCCYRGILENRRPSVDNPQNECFYDDNSALVDEDHEYSGCRGTPNQFDSASDWLRHTFLDEGGIRSKGWGAFWTSRWRSLNQHFEREERRRMECHEICNQQPWYLRGFCLQGCSPSLRMR